jgi:hypothetical protein
MMEEILKEIQKLVPEVLGGGDFGFFRKRYDGKRTKGV